MKDPRYLLLKIDAFCCLAAPVILFLADLLLGNALTDPSSGSAFVWSIGLWLAFVLFLPAIVGTTYMLAADGSRLGVIGGCFALFGAAAGASMQIFFRVIAVLGERGDMQTIEQLRSTMKLVLTTQSIGLAWPIGLLLLAIAAFTTRAVNIAVPIALVIGAIAFPIGRIAFVYPAVLLSGAAFIVAFWIIGASLWNKEIA